MNTLRKLTENFNTNIMVRFDEPMAGHTTFKVGGKADAFFEPASTEELKTLIEFLKTNGQQFFVFGGGSNLVVSDDGIEGAVICTRKMNSISLMQNTDGLYLNCAAGTLMDEIAEFCEKNSISGLETFSGLPGTIGGAVFMNARCYEHSISDVLKSAVYFDEDTRTIQSYEFNEADWAYKKSPFQNRKAVILEAQLKCAAGEKEQIKTLNAHYIEDRKGKGHFKFPSAGSVFKNNHDFGSPSGKIIDQAGLRGFSIGGAQIAPWHGNFIINTGNATAEDIHNLVIHVTNEVKKQTGFVLEPEIIFVGRNF